jgi:anti-sigma regulatory factor (Ser/Thr protein kinase)
VAAIGNATIVTCVYAVLDSRAGTLTYGTAGHVPPLLTVPGSPTRLLTAGDPPLGSDSYQGAIETVDWMPGSRLTLYTDGLVEHRGGDIDATIERLARLLDDTSLAVEEVPNHLVATLLPDRPTDDVAVLTVAARRPGSRDFAMSIPPVGTSVSEARHAASTKLREWGVDDAASADVVLLVSELVTNTLRHAQPPIEVRMRLDTGESDRIVLDVSDGAALSPTLREMDPAATTGRGLHLVSALARSWGARPTGGGKSVWCVFDLPGA